MSKHDTVKKKKKTITENNIFTKTKFEHFFTWQKKKKKKERNTSGSQARKEKKKNLTINKTCVCDPHSLNISLLNLGHEGEEEEEKKKERERQKQRDIKIFWTQSRQLTFYKLSVNIYEPTFPSSFSETHQPLLMRPHAFSQRENMALIKI